MIVPRTLIDKHKGFADACDYFASHNAKKGFCRTVYGHARAIIEPIFKYSKTIKIYDKSLNDSIFNFKGNKDLIEGFSNSIWEKNRKLEILLNEGFNKEFFKFFKEDIPFSKGRIDLRITQNKLYCPLLVGDGLRFIIAPPEFNYFVYNFNDSKYVKKIISCFDKEFSQAEKLVF